MALSRTRDAATATEDGSQPSQPGDVFSPIKTRQQRQQDRQDAPSEEQSPPPMHAPESQASPMTSACSTPSGANQEEIWALKKPAAKVVCHQVRQRRRKLRVRRRLQAQSATHQPLPREPTGQQRQPRPDAALPCLGSGQADYHDDLMFYKGKKVYLRTTQPSTRPTPGPKSPLVDGP